MARRSFRKNRRKQKSHAPASAESRAIRVSRLTRLRAALSSPVFIHAATLIFIGLWVFFPALTGGWLWDDDLYLTDNAIKHDPAGLWKIWFAPGSFIEYYPIEASVQWTQWQILGNDPSGYHLTNVVLHLAGALLVWRLLDKLGLRLAWWGALLFTIHPVMVESVAWISELKNTLSLPPFLLAMCAWIDFDEHRRTKDYVRAFAWFLVAMLCKVSVVMFPVVILLYAWWKRERIGWKDLQASAPFFVLSLGLTATAILCAQIYGTAHPVNASMVPLNGILPRLALAGDSLTFYFSKCVLPVGLLPIYPQWSVTPPVWWQFLPWPVLAATVFLLWTKRDTWGRHVLFGLGFFAINLFPFLGLRDISYMRFTWVMDHFLYLPIIGLIALAIAAADSVTRRLKTSAQYGALAAAAILLGLLAHGSYRYAKIFHSQETLWTYALKYNPQSLMAHDNLAQALMRRGRFNDAIREYRIVLAIDPAYAPALTNLGVTLTQVGRMPEAIDYMQKALQLAPDEVSPHNNLGIALVKVGRIPEGIEQYRDSLRIKPGDAQTLDDLGCALRQSGQITEAIEQFRLALQSRPDFADAQNNLGLALAQSGNMPEAIIHFRAAVRINPNLEEAHANLGLALDRNGQLPEAIAEYQLALQLKPTDDNARRSLARALFKQQGLK